MKFMEHAMNSDKEIFDKYHETFYKVLHGWRDYEKSSKGFSMWYYDCLPSDKKVKILDIGCGDGKFLYFLIQNGYTEIEGLELSHSIAAEANKNVGCPIKVVDDTIAYLMENPERFHTITMNDVLEHIDKKETIHFLSAVKNAIVPGGNLIVNVPQVSGISSLYCRYIDFSHQIIYTEMSLRQVLMLAGFEEIRFIKEKWPFKLTPRHVMYRLVRWMWYSILKFIYFIEQPSEIHPHHFQIRLVASATRK